MEVGEGKLIDVFLEIDRFLSGPITIIAVGGTALTLLGKKESTRDIDICFISENDKDRFVKTAERLGYDHQQGKLIGRGIVIDIFVDGYIFCVQLPEDYAKKSVHIRQMKHLDLFTLNPQDLIITKTARFNERDRQDIRIINGSFDLDMRDLVRRYMSCMEKSMVRDSKGNLLALANMLGFPEGLVEKIMGWEHGQL